MVQYLDVADILEIHIDIMSRLGITPQALVREGDLRSALGRPQWAAYYESADFIAQAARLTTGVVRAHGFVDGNKRTAYAALLVFLEMNDFRFTGDHLALGSLLVRLAGPDISDSDADAELEAFLRLRVVTG